MYVRSTTFRGEPSAIDDGIAYARDTVRPALERMAGWIGLSLLVDRHTGHCVVNTSWDDAEAMRRSADAVRELRETTISTVRGVPGETEVQEWQVGVMHRVLAAPERAACRVIRTRAPIGQAGRIAEGFQTTIVPRIADLPGFCSVSLLVDDETGRCAVTTVYEDRQTMNRAKGHAQAMREEFATHLGMHVTDVAEYDVALAHLRVPETV
jgi:heme-degrading monooxygenase HmoA